MKHLLLTLPVIALAACGGTGAGEVAEINNDWTGNEIKIESFEDEDVQGVTCHMAHFDRGVIDRLSKGDWFENPSNGSISCGITGPVTIGSGCEFALAACDLGKTAVEAVEYASTRDVFTGGGVDWVCLNSHIKGLNRAT